jgi:cardiolipin synthase A/B
MYKKTKAAFLFILILCLSFSAFGSIQTVIIEPEDGVAPVVDLISQTKKSIDISIYKISGYSNKMNTLILKSLINAKKRDVKIRLLLNNFNNNKWPKSGKKYLKQSENWCEKYKIKFRLSSSAFKYSHNKYIILDEKVALIMTCNLSSEELSNKSNTRNFIISEDDKEVVNYLSKLFYQDWVNAKDNTSFTPNEIPDTLLIGPNKDYSVKKIFELIRVARQKIDIFMMYFDESCPRKIIKSITDASKRGVQIRLLCSSIQKKSVLEKRFGKKRKGKYVFPENLKFVIQTKNSKLPFIHAKVFIIDEKTVILGSMNMSYTSLYLNREVDIIVSDKNVIAKIQKTFDSDWQNYRRNFNNVD